MNQKPSILVTGGAGYVGSMLVTDLANQGYRVKIIDSMIFEKKKTTNIFNNKSVDVINGDIRNRDLLENSLNDINCVIHLAAITGPLCDRIPNVTKQINQFATEQLIELCKKNSDPFEVDQVIVYICPTPDCDQAKVEQDIKRKMLLATEVTPNEVHFVGLQEMVDRLELEVANKAKRIIDTRPKK